MAAGRTSTGRIKKGFRLTKGGKVVKASGGRRRKARKKARKRSRRRKLFG